MDDFDSGSSSFAFDQSYQSPKSSVVRNWTGRSRSSAVPYSFMVVDTSCGHVCLLCTSHRGQAWSTRRSIEFHGGGHLLRPRLSSLHVPWRAGLERMVNYVCCCLAVAVRRVSDANEGASGGPVVRSGLSAA